MLRNGSLVCTAEGTARAQERLHILLPLEDLLGDVRIVAIRAELDLAAPRFVEASRFGKQDRLEGALARGQIDGDHGLAERSALLTEGTPARWIVIMMLHHGNSLPTLVEQSSGTLTVRKAPVNGQVVVERLVVVADAHIAQILQNAVGRVLARDQLLECDGVSDARVKATL